MRRENVSLLRWLAVPVAAGSGAWLASFLSEVLLHLVQRDGFFLARLLVAGYVSLAAGFMFNWTVTHIAPKGRYFVAVALVFVMVVVAGVLMRNQAPDGDPLPAVLLGTSLVVGAFGYAVRVRGFTEPVGA